MVAILLAAFAQSCGEDLVLPTAPSDFSTGVIVYEEVGYRGASGHITADTPDLRDFVGPCEYQSGGDGLTSHTWNDCISSLRVAQGWRATLYRDPNYRGDSIVITEDHSNLQLVRQHDCPQGGLNDCVSSLRVGRQ